MLGVAMDLLGGYPTSTTTTSNASFFDLVDRPVLADANPPRLAASQPAAARGSRAVRQGQDGGLNAGSMLPLPVAPRLSVRSAVLEADISRLGALDFINGLLEGNCFSVSFLGSVIGSDSVELLGFFYESVVLLDLQQNTKPVPPTVDDVTLLFDNHR
jgi:hypothetical protein